MTQKFFSGSPAYQSFNDIYALNMYQYPQSVPGFAVGNYWSETASYNHYGGVNNYYPKWHHQNKMSDTRRKKKSFTIRGILGLESDELNDGDGFSSQNLLPPRLTPEPAQMSSIRCFENEDYPNRVEAVSSTDFYLQSVPTSSRLSPPCLEPQSTSSCRKSEDGLSPGKKSKRVRTTFTALQLQKLELEFGRTQYMVGSARIQLALELNLTEAQVKVWFQNRRIKQRKQFQETQQAKLAKLKENESNSDSDNSFSSQISSSCSSSSDDSQLQRSV